MAFGPSHSISVVTIVKTDLATLQKSFWISAMAGQTNVRGTPSSLKLAQKTGVLLTPTKAMFDILETDIVVMQETKIQRKDLRDDMVLVPGWDSFFSLPKYKKGESHASRWY